MWPRLIASKILSKTLSGNNLVTDFPMSLEPFVLRSTSDLGSDIPVILPENHTTQNCNIFVGTWNVGGVTPTDDLNIDDLLDTHDTSCDIYVIGFQEVVPLKASNVLGLKKKKISRKWNTMIKKTLNKKSRISELSSKSNTERSNLLHDFHCLKSKRMVGLLISVWVRSNLHQLIRNLDVSCVGCGIMGCLGNKGSVSIRFMLHDTSFCFVCSHLASGGGEGDERNRNSNAVDIFSRTSFPTSKLGSSVQLPKRILDHDRVVLLGDLNYRISLPDKETRSLVYKKDWSTLIEYDQLRMELTEGQFRAWHEGAINFAPTYKYLPNSDEYFDKDFETKRAPAWCDRIIWTGEGLKQILYDRCESNLSDHRPVKAIFTTQVQVSQAGCRTFYFSDRFNQIPADLELVSSDEYSTNRGQLNFQSTIKRRKKNCSMKVIG
ncbi:endonuclease/exonuclease/phosphatase [Artemisia annua]|uniref:Endonuclease/exonuclease/phosphatase n=1 Tax=Artemisia annua TaxID=35608 RepID=A0A2U1M223_ARTAN|nr:endonuclease/exonuclease/phosphatase [Artemisia annua]